LLVSVTEKGPPGSDLRRSKMVAGNPGTKLSEGGGERKRKKTLHRAEGRGGGEKKKRPGVCGCSKKKKRGRKKRRRGKTKKEALSLSLENRWGGKKRCRIAGHAAQHRQEEAVMGADQTGERKKRETFSLGLAKKKKGTDLPARKKKGL